MLSSCLILVFISSAVSQPSSDQGILSSKKTPPADVHPNIWKQVHDWDRKARLSFGKRKIRPWKSGTKSLLEFRSNRTQSRIGLAQNVYECFDIQCICTFMSGTMRGSSCSTSRGILRKAVRKEIRMMTSDEWIRYYNAFWRTRSPTYLELVTLHSSPITAPGAHSGPAFHPWHREFLKRQEISLRSYDPTVSIPYWDSTLDARLPDPTASVLWSSELLGLTNSSGYLMNGAFKQWRGHTENLITREIGDYSILINDVIVQRVLNRPSYIEFLASTAGDDDCPRPLGIGVPEFAHGNNHLWVGGDMGPIPTSANDPIFFCHHSFVDNLWETWRLNRQSRAQRESQYPDDDDRCSSSAHFAGAPMEPFSTINVIDGLSNLYTDNLYSYDARPTCSQRNRNCQSRFLFCDLSSFQCVSRVRAGSECSTSQWGGADPCYKSTCRRGICA